MVMVMAMVKAMGMAVVWVMPMCSLVVSACLAVSVTATVVCQVGWCRLLLASAVEVVAGVGVRAGAGHVLPDAGRGTHGQAHQAGLPPARQEQEPEAERRHHRRPRHGLGQTG